MQNKISYSRLPKECRASFVYPHINFYKSFLNYIDIENHDYIKIVVNNNKNEIKFIFLKTKKANSVKILKRNSMISISIKSKVEENIFIQQIFQKKSLSARIFPIYSLKDKKNIFFIKIGRKYYEKHREKK